MFRVGIITCSDKGYKNERIDESGMLIQEIMKSQNYEIAKYIVLADDMKMIKEQLIYMSDELCVDIILTTGGTGFSKRDITPEATLDVIDRQTPGISEAIRNYSMQITKNACLSRAVSGIRNQTLIINLPGSKKAVKESLEYIINPLKHGLCILKGIEIECAR